MDKDMRQYLFEKTESLFLSLDKMDMLVYEEFSKFNINIDDIKDLKIATIVDDFTYLCLRSECSLIQLSLKNCIEEFDSFKPHMLFIESAWMGLNGDWNGKVVNGSLELFELMDHAKANGVPIVFWNKEDPVFTFNFMCVAQKADFVFTSDIDQLPVYFNNLQHKNVYFMHFAAQPKLHNPIQNIPRLKKSCFAGAYYSNYPRRAKIFNEFVKTLESTIGIDIYDRFYGKNIDGRSFPQDQQKHILGSLEANEIDKAYKGYEYGINTNSINQSQSMFARRVFELMASNTLVLSNYSRGLKNFFADLCICTDSSSELESKINSLESDPLLKEKIKLIALRKVLSKHCYSNRLQSIVYNVFKKAFYDVFPLVNVIAIANDEKEYNNILNSYNKQSYNNCDLYILSENESLLSKSHVSKNIDSTRISNDSYIAYFDSNSYYSENYIYDLMLSIKYAEADVYGKHRFFSYNNENFETPSFEEQYTYVNSIPAFSSIFKAELLENIDPYQLKNYAFTKNCFSAGFLGFCYNFIGKNCDLVDDIKDINTGCDFNTIEFNYKNSFRIGEYSRRFRKLYNSPMLSLNSVGSQNYFVNVQGINIFKDTDSESEIYINDIYKASAKKIDVRLIAFGNMDICFNLTFCKDKHEIKTHEDLSFNMVHTFELPERANLFKIVIRSKSQGFYTVKSIEYSQSLPLIKTQLITQNKDVAIFESEEQALENIDCCNACDFVIVSNNSLNGYYDLNYCNVFSCGYWGIDLINNNDYIKNIHLFSSDTSLEKLIDKSKNIIKHN